MRTVNVLSGVAVLLTTLAFAHLVDHFVSHSPAEFRSAFWFWPSFGLAALIGIFSLVGGCLLLRRR